MIKKHLGEPLFAQSSYVNSGKIYIGGDVYTTYKILASCFYSVVIYNYIHMKFSCIMKTFCAKETLENVLYDTKICAHKD